MVVFSSAGTVGKVVELVLHLLKKRKKRRRFVGLELARTRSCGSEHRRFEEIV